MGNTNSFKPICSSNDKIVIVGTVPGNTSLKNGYYYLDPRNSFWEILDYVFDTDSYFADLKDSLLSCNNPCKRRKIIREIKNRLNCLGVAICDIIETCDRTPGLSADKAIAKNSIIINKKLDKNYKNAKHIFINGKKKRGVSAGALFEKSFSQYSNKTTCLNSSSNACSVKKCCKKTEWKKEIRKYI